ncbi:hypothetical protein PR048_023760 [Dryococelus australis]|uniref:Uncharacterized protein n=1 Tax=Dryococelus australis TaxID=614101 RepID=A0ABQ9GV20_9NEOP|nr:hypothetical protein PR048_023760 [Dryococelus australis]
MVVMQFHLPYPQSLHYPDILAHEIVIACEIADTLPPPPSPCGTVGDVCIGIEGIVSGLHRVHVLQDPHTAFSQQVSGDSTIFKTGLRAVCAILTKEAKQSDNTVESACTVSGVMVSPMVKTSRDAGRAKSEEWPGSSCGLPYFAAIEFSDFLVPGFIGFTSSPKTYFLHSKCKSNGSSRIGDVWGGDGEPDILVRHTFGGMRATVAEPLAHSALTKANRVKSLARSRDFRKWESCWTMPLVGWFSRGFPISPPFHSSTTPYSLQSPSLAIKTLLLRAAQISSLTPRGWEGRENSAARPVKKRPIVIDFNRKLSSFATVLNLLVALSQSVKYVKKEACYRSRNVPTIAVEMFPVPYSELPSCKMVQNQEIAYIYSILVKRLGFDSPAGYGIHDGTSTTEIIYLDVGECTSCPNPGDIKKSVQAIHTFLLSGSATSHNSLAARGTEDSFHRRANQRGRTFKPRLHNQRRSHRTRKESTTVCSKDGSWRVILGNHGKQKSGWPDQDSNPRPPECDSAKIYDRTTQLERQLREASVPGPVDVSSTNPENSSPSRIRGSIRLPGRRPASQSGVRRQEVLVTERHRNVYHVLICYSRRTAGCGTAELPYNLNQAVIGQITQIQHDVEAVNQKLEHTSDGMRDENATNRTELEAVVEKREQRLTTFEQNSSKLEERISSQLDSSGHQEAKLNHVGKRIQLVTDKLDDVMSVGELRLDNSDNELLNSDRLDRPEYDRATNNTPAMFLKNALMHHPRKMWADQMHTFEGKSGENPLAPNPLHRAKMETRLALPSSWNDMRSWLSDPLLRIPRMPTVARLAGVTDLLSPVRVSDTFSDDARMFW